MKKDYLTMKGIAPVRLVAATRGIYREIVGSLNESAFGTRFSPNNQYFYCSFDKEEGVDVRGDMEERTIYLFTNTAVKRLMGKIKWPKTIGDNN